MRASVRASAKVRASSEVRGRVCALKLRRPTTTAAPNQPTPCAPGHQPALYTRARGLLRSPPAAARIRGWGGRASGYEAASSASTSSAAGSAYAAPADTATAVSGRRPEPPRRRLVKAVCAGEAAGDTSSLVNPEILDVLRAAFSQSGHGGQH